MWLDAHNITISSAKVDVIKSPGTVEQTNKISLYVYIACMYMYVWIGTIMRSSVAYYNMN